MKINLFLVLSLFLTPLYGSEELKEDSHASLKMAVTDDEAAPKRKNPRKPKSSQSSKPSRSAKAAGAKLLINDNAADHEESSDPAANVDLQQDVPGNEDNYLRGSRMFWIVSENVLDGLKSLCVAVTPAFTAVAYWSGGSTSTDSSDGSNSRNVWGAMAFGTSTATLVLDQIQKYAAKSKLDREKALAHVIDKHNRLNPQSNGAAPAVTQTQ